MERKNAWNYYSAEERKRVEDICHAYCHFLDCSKTERECAASAIKLARAQGYRDLELIREAKGHVCTFYESAASLLEGELHITSRVNTAEGIACRGVAEILPEYASPVEPTLEDAYLYLIVKEGMAL